MTAESTRVGLLMCIALSAFCSSGCGGGLRPGRLDQHGFVHQHYEYEIAALPDGSLLGAWQVENFQVDSRGRFAASKVGPDWIYRPSVDRSGDGTAEDAPEEPIYDLLLRSPTDAGEIWVRTVPFRSIRARADLRVLARMYADAIAGVGLRAVHASPDGVEIVERRFATRQIDTRRGLIDNREAFEMTLDIANVDQLELDREARWVRSRILIIRTELAWRPRSGSLRPGEGLLPMFMIVGYSNLPEDFEAGAPAFASLVTRLRFETARTAELREVTLACSDRPIVRFVATYPGQLRRVDGVTGEEDECIARSVPPRVEGLGDWRSYAFLAAPPTVPTDAPEPPETQDAAEPAEPPLPATPQASPDPEPDAVPDGEN